MTRNNIVNSVSVSVAGLDRIIAFETKELLTEALKANPHLVAVFGDTSQDDAAFPGLYIAGIKAN